MNAMDDKNLTISELKTLVKTFCKERDWDQYHTPKDLAIGLITEAAELLEHFRFRSIEQCLEDLKDPVKNEEIRDELSDALFFILRFSQCFDIDLSSSLQKKIEKNEKKYPVNSAKGSNKKYTEF